MKFVVYFALIVWGAIALLLVVSPFLNYRNGYGFRLIFTEEQAICLRPDKSCP